MSLPIYEMMINPEEGSDVEVSFVALVDKPAIERNFMTFNAFDYENFGGPGSGPQGGGDDSGGDDDPDTQKILAKPRHERSEGDIKHLLKRKKKTEVKEIADNGKKWLKSNPDKVGTPEHRTVSREVNVADKIVKGFYQSQVLHFAIDTDKRIISGPAMVADVPIYRKDEGGEYNVFFSAATIKEIALKFAKKGYAKNLNLFHDPNMPADGVAIFNSFVSDKSMGIHPMKGFEDLPDGSWFISAKVESDEIWAKIKAGELKGFSVEGNFSFKKTGMNSQNAVLQESGIMSDIKTLLKDVKDFLFNAAPPPPAATAAPVVAEAVKAKLKDGTEVSVSEMVAGGVVMIGMAPAPAGEHELEDGTKITVGEGGVITAIVPATQAAPPPADYTKEFASVNEKLTGYEQKFAGYESKFTAYETKFAEQATAIAKAQAMNEKLFAIVEKLAEAPTADPASTSGNNFNSQYSEDRAEKIARLSASLNKLKTA